MSTKHILIIAGEASGDLHAAHLVKAALRLNPALRFTGIGCGKMREAGVALFMDATELAVVGFVEAIAKIKPLLVARHKIKQQLNRCKPDLIILVDYPGFNLRIAKMAKKAGIKVMYYISPQIWAWRQGRIKLIKKSVDHMAVILPFEAALYEQAHVPVTFVGHPLTAQVSCNLTQAEARHAWGLPQDTAVVCLMPGSRRQEIEMLLPDMLKAATRLHQKKPTLQFTLALAPTVDRAMLAPYLTAYKTLPLKIITNETYQAIRASDLVITASGTATLEISLLEVPMIILYKLSFLTYFIIKRMTSLSDISLCNIIAGKRICPELIQQEANATVIVREALALLDNAKRRLRMQQDLKAVKASLGSGDASQQAAEVALKLLSK